MARNVTTGNLGLEIPAGDPNFYATLNERLRRIGFEIEKSNGSRTDVVAPAAVTPAATVTLPEVAGALAIINGVIQVKGGGITTDLIKTFAVSSAKLAAAAVLTDKIANGAVTTTKIQNASITNALIANLAVGAANIQDAAIGTVKIQNGAITNALIANLAVTDAKIGSLAANKITAGTLVAVNLSGGTLTLTLNGVTTNIDNAFSFNGVDTMPAFRMSDNTTGLRAMIMPRSFSVSNADGSGIGAYLGFNDFAKSGILSLYNPALGPTASITVSGGVGASQGQISVGLFKVLGARQTGWGTPSGTLTRTTYNDASVTLQQLAQRVSALIVDARTHGLIGN